MGLLLPPVDMEGNFLFGGRSVGESARDAIEELPLVLVQRGDDKDPENAIDLFVSVAGKLRHLHAVVSRQGSARGLETQKGVIVHGANVGASSRARATTATLLRRQGEVLTETKADRGAGDVGGVGGRHGGWLFLLSEGFLLTD